MESAQQFPGGLGPSDCPDLAGLYESHGPFVSCYIDTDAATEDALQRLEIRRKDVRRELESLSASEADAEAVDEALAGTRALGEAVGIIVEGGGVRVLEGAETPIGSDVVRHEPLPSIGPVLLWRQHRIPYLAVACDHAGADIGVSTRTGTDTTAVGDPDSHDPTLHKVSSGGWSQRRYQARVENAWERNARAATEALERLTHVVSPRVILIGGDPQAVSLVKEHAGPRARPLLEDAPISRAVDGSERHDAQAIRRAVETAVAADTAHLLAALREMRAKDLAAEGPRDVLAALTAAQVDTLLVHDDPADERTAFLSAEPLVAGLERAEVSAVGGDATEARLVDVAIAAAFRTGAKVRLVPSHPAGGGLAALLRYSA